MLGREFFFLTFKGGKSSMAHDKSCSCLLFQVHHTFATAGSDGSFNFWDKDSKQRLKVYLEALCLI